MSGSDIGVGDVVEAVRDSTWPPGMVQRGDRATVTGIEASCYCPWCNERSGILLLNRFCEDGIGWCVSLWRKIGGSQADTIRRFAEDLNVRTHDVSAPTKPEREMA